MKIENKDYELIPVDWNDGEQGWDIRILTGDFVETVVRFGQLGVENEELHFSFSVIDGPDDELTSDNEDLQKTVGEILISVVENSIHDKSVEITDRQNGKSIEY